MRTAICILFMGLLLRFPTDSAESARHAMHLWAADVAPSLFPYMVICRMLSDQLRKHKVPAAAVILPLGLLGGSPSGSAVLAESVQDYSPRHLLPFCALTGTMSPMFILGTAGKWLKENTSVSAGVLLAAHWGGAVLSCMLVCLFSKLYLTRASAPANTQIPDQADSIKQSTAAIFHIGGCMVFYSVIACLCAHLPRVSRSSLAIIHAFLEAGGGLFALSSLHDSPSLHRALLFAAASGFSGLSILSQNYIFLKQVGIRFHTLLGLAILRACCCAAMMLVMYPFSVR